MIKRISNKNKWPKIIKLFKIKNNNKKCMEFPLCKGINQNVHVKRIFS